MGQTMYVRAAATQLVETANEGKAQRHALLWGDAVTEATIDDDGKLVTGVAHGHKGQVPLSALQDEPLNLLEIYVIDVGQGDSILFRTPDGVWHLMDGGPPKARSLIGEGARNFIAWKFGADLNIQTVPLQTVILSHSDEDHFGGLTAILRSEFPPDPETHQNNLMTTVEHLLHAGVAKYEKAGLGVVKESKNIPAARLLDDRESFKQPPLPFATSFGDFADAVVKVRNAAQDDCEIKRVRAGDTVPDYGPGNGSGVDMSVLGPVPEDDGSLPDLGDDSHTVNGHSVVVRLDFGHVRILLTGDINAVSQRRLLSRVDPQEFRSDVIKACHHGAEDIDWTFTKAVGPRVTVVSSGDNEDYSHPRPPALGGYAYYGRRSFKTKAQSDAQSQPPFVYMTEVARSIKTEALVVKGHPMWTVKDAVYGLVNVRTDGQKVVCAVRDELNDRFDVEELWVGAEDAPPDDR